MVKNNLIVRYGWRGLLGLALGFSLSRLGFSDYGEVHRMFTFTDLRLFLTFVGAVVLTMMGLRFFASGNTFPKKTIHRGTVPGGLLFGLGWAITGACPAIPLVQLGEGRLPAALTMVGIFLGIVIHRRLNAAVLHWDSGVCEN